MYTCILQDISKNNDTTITTRSILIIIVNGLRPEEYVNKNRCSNHIAKTRRKSRSYLMTG